MCDCVHNENGSSQNLKTPLKLAANIVRVQDFICTSDIDNDVFCSY